MALRRLAKAKGEWPDPWKWSPIAGFEFGPPFALTHVLA